MPCDWQKSIICPIYKKGDKLVCNNYKSISLLCVPHKLFTSILQDEVKWRKRLKQGDGLAPLFFNLVLEHVFRQLYSDTRGTLEYKSVHKVGYADDINLIGRSWTAVKEVFEDLNKEGKRVGLKINESKTKVLIQAKTSRQLEEWINLGGDNVEVGADRTYMGTHLINKHKELVETKAQIQAANKAYYSNLSLIKFHDINWRVWVTLYKTLICSILA
jgi:Reverse transcriptase (RNA-dependent DNA polymerase).